MILVCAREIFRDLAHPGPRVLKVNLVLPEAVDRAFDDDEVVDRVVATLRMRVDMVDLLGRKSAA